MSDLDVWLVAHLEGLADRWRLDAAARQELRALVEGLSDTSLLTQVREPPEPPPPTGPRPTARAEDERYEDRGLIGLGGMGEVRRVYDRRLGRVVARKSLRVDLAHRADLIARFQAETALTASMSHPGVVPVHDTGTLPDGRPWFTMAEVRGETLRARIRRTPLDARELYTRIQALRDAARAVGYAHGLGLVHRDLKPDNLMIGEHGEVLVLDWGLSRGGSAGSPGAGYTTAAGTAGYRPDGLAGPPSPAWDVYALGVILHEIVGGRVGLHGPEGVVPAWIPSPLVSLAELARGDRAPSAPVFAYHLDRWLSGETDRALADAWTEAAEQALAEAEIATARAVRLHAEARQLATDATAPIEAHRRMWEAEDRARDAADAADQARAAGLRGLTAALGRVPDHPRARQILGDHDERAAEEATSRGDVAGARAAIERLRATDPARWASYTAAMAAVTLVTEVPARVCLRPIVERDRRWEPGEPVDLGPTPLLARTIPPGNYLFEIRAEGYHLARYPVRVGRNEHWDGVPPGAREPWPIRLLPDSEPTDGIYVPAGWTTIGGDPQSIYPTPRARVWVDGFQIDRFPVGWPELLVMMQAAWDAGAHADFDAMCPRLRTTSRADSGTPLVEVAGGVVRLAGAVDPALPVHGISWLGANTAGRWRPAGRGAPWRLPWDVEWEKAARGVDERRCPWGPSPEPIYSANRQSVQYGLVPNERFPTDVSVYGVRGLAGNVKDFVADAWRPEGPEIRDGRALRDPGPADAGRVARGGSCGARSTDAVATYRAPFPAVTYLGLQGFRLARDVDSTEPASNG